MLQFVTPTGSISPIHSKDVAFSRLGIGLEKLDRNLYSPAPLFDPIAELGVKWVRLQSGWQRTETEKGVYHFEWLDDIVDNLLRRGLVPWICLCYGNRLYDKQAAERFGGVGCPPTFGDEQTAAWSRYTEAVVRHFKGRIDWWEIWNEPDCDYSWRFQCNPLEYIEMAKKTAEAIRKGNPEAKIIGGSLAFSDLDYVIPLLDNGLVDFCDAVTFHIYSSNDIYDQTRIDNLKEVVRRYNPATEIIMGEGGCQSRNNGAGALTGQAWTEEKQARSLARHVISNLHDDLKFVSVFSCADMAEALNGKVGEAASYNDFGYFGVMGAEFDSDGVFTGSYRRKPSFRALQTIAAIFKGEFSVAHIPLAQIDNQYSVHYNNMGTDLTDCKCCGFRKPNGSAAVALWKPTNILSETYEGAIYLKFAMVPHEKVQLVDMLDGTIYELPADSIERKESGTLALKHIPLLDSPVLVAFGDFF